jgi:5'-methylthioadenosine phosphorylase
MTSKPIRFAVIGGSGLYQMPGLAGIEELEISTPFGAPSDRIIVGEIEGVPVAFLPRHGRGHIHSPTEVPYRANIYALKTLGVERIISVSACGSLREDYAPGHIVIPDQLYDNTRERTGRTFFGGGIVAHVAVDHPFCADLSHALAASTRRTGATVHEGGQFVTIEGPRFSTKSESNVYRSWGMSLVGMTASPEAQLAREAEMCYAVMAHVTDYDVWHESEEPVTVERVVQTLNANLGIAQQALARLIPEIAHTEITCDCHKALETAMITDRSRITPDVIARLKPLIGKYFGS